MCAYRGGGEPEILGETVLMTTTEILRHGGKTHMNENTGIGIPAERVNEMEKQERQRWVVRPG